MFIMPPPEKNSMVVLVNDKEMNFTELYNKFLPLINNYVLYRVNDRNDAEDLTSLIFEKLLANFSEYKPDKANFSTWHTAYHEIQSSIIIVIEISHSLVLWHLKQ